jgi:hypothetical protein
MAKKRRPPNEGSAGNSSNRRLDPSNFYVNVWPMTPHRISKVDRTARREALSQIFDVLEAKTFRQRVKLTRAIIYEISRYYDQGNELWHQNQSESRAWFYDVAKHSQALADLIARFPRNFAGDVMSVYENQHEQVENTIGMLHAWAARTQPLGSTDRPLRRGDKRDMRRLLLINRLSRVYQVATGRKATRVIDRETLKPISPFHHFMRGVWTLAGVKKGDGAIDKEVRLWKEWVGSWPNYPQKSHNSAM